MSMKILIKENTAQRALVSLCGELDSQAAETFEKEMTPFIENPVHEIVMDFSELEYISSAGMRTLLLMSRGATQKGGKVSITGMNDNIRQIFKLTGFDALMDIL